MIIALSGKAGSGKNLTADIIQYLLWKNSINKTELPLSTSTTTLEGFSKLPTTTKNRLSGWEQKAFAYKLKQIVSILTGIPVEDLDKQEVKERVLGEEWNRTFYKIIDSDGTVLSKTFYKEDAKLDLAYYEDYHHRTVELIEFQNKPITVRQLLQTLGTDLLRNQLHPNVHINSLFADYRTNFEARTIEEWGKDLQDKWIITDIRFKNELQAVKDVGGITIRVNRPCEECGVLEGHKMIPHKNTPSTHPSETSLDNEEFDFVINNDSTIEALCNKVEVILKQLKIL